MRGLKLSIGPVTGDMISPPLSPSSDLNFNVVNPDVLSALQYVSRRLQRKSIHISFIVFHEKPLPIGHGYKLHTLPILPLDEPTRRTSNHYIGRAAKKFDLQPDWITHQPSRHNVTSEIPNGEYIVKRTLLQNDVLFSQEGITLLNVDRILTLKQQLNALSKGSTGHIPEYIYKDSCLWLLRQIMKETNGRPFTKGFFHCAYDHLQVRDELIVNLATAYAFRYNHDGIVLPRLKSNPKQKSNSKLRSRKLVEQTKGVARIAGVGTRRQSSNPKPGPKTPNSATDVTPITRSEWKLLMEKGGGGIKIVPVQETG